MTLPTIQFDLHPMDIYNICLLLRRFKEKRGPRSLRYVLEPGLPVKDDTGALGQGNYLRTQYLPGAHQAGSKDLGQKKVVDPGETDTCCKKIYRSFTGHRSAFILYSRPGRYEFHAGA